MQELIYTSYTKGVKPGVSGFCTVVVSSDMAPNRISRLESLSGYRHLYQPGTPDAALNPPAWSHVLMNVGDSEFHVVYRVGDAGLDYTGRSNKLGHFIVLEKKELPSCGPATMLLTPGLIETQFDGNVGTRPFTRPIPHQLVSPRPCNLWKQIAGDAGWAGLLAQTAYTGQHACILFKPGTDMLPLIQEALALLPPEMRWKTTFSTYFSKLPTGLDCQWRCAVAGTPEAELAMAEREKMLVIDLSRGSLGMAPNSPTVMAARTGRAIVTPKNDVQNKTHTNSSITRAKQTNSKVSNEEILLDLEQIDTQNNDLLDSFDSSSPILSITSKSKSQKKKQYAKEIPLSTWVIIGASVLILLIGIMVGVIFCLSNPSQTIATINEPVKTENDTDSNESSNTDIETVDSTIEDENSLEEQRQQEEAQSREQEERNAQQKAEEEKRLADQKKKEEEEAQRKEQEERDAQQKAKEEKRLAEQKKKEEEEAQRKAEKEKAERERKAIFDDPRWFGISEEYWFIFVNPDNTLDYSRLNYQIKDNIDKIDKIEAISVLDALVPDQKFSIQKTESGKYACYTGDKKCELAIEINNELQSNGLQQNGYLAFTDGPEMDDFIKQCVLKVTFLDKKTKIISFVSVEKNNQLLDTLKKASKDQNGTLPTNMSFPDYNKEGEFLLSNKIDINFQVAKQWEYGKNLSIERKENNEIEIKIEVNKSVELKSYEGKGIEPDKGEKVNVEKLIVYITPSNTGKTFQIRIKYKFLLKGDSEPIGDNNTIAYQLFKNQEFKSFVQKNIEDLPIYIDLSLSHSKEASESFLWKRLIIKDIQSSK